MAKKLGSRWMPSLLRILPAALASLALPAQTEACDPEEAPETACPEPKPRREFSIWTSIGNVHLFPALLTPFGGGSDAKRRLGVFGGDVLGGYNVLIGDEGDSFVLMPTVGWSGWRTLDKLSSLRANTFTGRLDLGYMNFDVLQGITVFAAGRIGTGRGPEDDRGPFQLYGAQVGMTYWPLTGWVPHAGIIGLEFQSNYTHYLGEWHQDIRGMLMINVGLIFIPFVILQELGL